MIFLPPAARGALFEKTAPLDPPQKLLIKGGHSLPAERIFRQTMTALLQYIKISCKIPLYLKYYEEYKRR